MLDWVLQLNYLYFGMGHMLHLQYHFTASKFCSSEFIFPIPFKNRFKYNFGHLNWMWFLLKPFNSHILYLCTATSRQTYSTDASNTFDGLLLVTCTAMPMPCGTILHIVTLLLQCKLQIYCAAEWIRAKCCYYLPVAVQNRLFGLNISMFSSSINYYKLQGKYRT